MKINVQHDISVKSLNEFKDNIKNKENPNVLYDIRR